jgi:hypothetical protein
MIIIPVNIGDVTSAVLEMLQTHPQIGLAGVEVVRSEEPPEQAGPEGFVGIYRGRVRYNSRTLGMGQGYRRQRIELAVHVRMTHYGSGEECETSLENLVTQVLSCILSDESLKGTVDVLDEEIEVQYPTPQRGEEVYLQSANIFFNGVVNVNVQEG